MKKFIWGVMALAALLTLNNRALAASASEVKDDLDTYKDEVNSGMGILSSRLGDAEKALGLKFAGDIRFREEYFYQAQDNQPSGVKTANIPDRNRLRVRFRFGASHAFGDSAKGTFRFATGSASDITSTNQTFSNDMGLKAINLDQAFITWAPSILMNKVRFDLGKMANIMAKTPISWDDDVNPEGVGLTVEPIAGTRLRGSYYSMRENAKYKDLYMFCAQVEQAFKPVSGLDVTLTAGMEWVPDTNMYILPLLPGYDVGGGAGLGENMNGPSTVGGGMVQDATSKNTIPDVHTVEGILVLKHNIDKIPVAWTFHLVDNVNSFNITSATVPAVLFKGADYSASNQVAFFAQLAVNKVSGAGDWAASFEWGYIEPNAVFGLYSDSDSGIGFNNNDWLKGTVELGLEDSLSFKISQYASWRQNYDVFGAVANNVMGSTSHQPILRSQVDMVVKL